MRTIVRFILLAVAVLTVIGISSCDEDSLAADPALSLTPYDKAESGSSTDQRINRFYEKYATRILYRFTPTTINSYWSNFSPVWYAPVKEGNEQYVEQAIDFLEQDVFNSLPDALVKKYLPFRIFLVDSLCNSDVYDEYTMTDILELSNHSVVLSHVGPDMEMMDDDSRQAIKKQLVTSTMNSIYNLAEHKPVRFNELRTDLGMVYLTPDPENELTDNEYTLYSNGLTGGNDALLNWMGCYIVPPASEDLAYFITFMITKSKTETDRILPRFDLLRRRCICVARFMEEEMGMTAAELQNAVCPDDPIPADYYTE